MDTKKTGRFNLPYLRERDLAWGIPFLLAAGALASLRKPKEVAMLPLLFLYPSFHLCKQGLQRFSMDTKKTGRFNLPIGEKGIWPTAFPFCSPQGPLQICGSLKRALCFLFYFCIPPSLMQTRFAPFQYGYKKTGRFDLPASANLRRERDSNPWNVSVQRFSRPPHSTTLPSLLPDWDCKGR